MSRSLHETVKGVFGGLSKRMIDELVERPDDRLCRLVTKASLKKRRIDRRGDAIVPAACRRR